MKTLIIYASRYGFTQECVGDLKKMIKGEVDTFNLQDGVEPMHMDYDNVVLGSSIYIGQIDKKLKAYVQQHLSELLKKRIFIFISCGILDQYEQNMHNAFPKELLNMAILKTCFGGELRLDKMKFGDKLMTKMMLKATEKQGKKAPCKAYQNIEAMVEAIHQLG